MTKRAYDMRLLDPGTWTCLQCGEISRTPRGPITRPRPAGPFKIVIKRSMLVIKPTGGDR